MKYGTMHDGKIVDLLFSGPKLVQLAVQKFIQLVEGGTVQVFVSAKFVQTHVNRA